MTASQNLTKLIAAKSIKLAATKAEAYMAEINRKTPGTVIDCLKVELTDKVIL